MTESAMYWLTRLDGVHSFINGLEFPLVLVATVAALTTAISYAVAKCDEKDAEQSGYAKEQFELAKGFFKTSLKTFACAAAAATCLGAASVFVPTTKEMAAIKVVPVLAGPETAEKLKEMSSDMVDAAAQWLKDAKEKRK